MNCEITCDCGARISLICGTHVYECSNCGTKFEATVAIRVNPLEER
jgi:predicted nucleic acid-binding Zn ribbon protein